MNWVYQSTMGGETWICGIWKISRARGTAIFNVYKNGFIVAIGYRDEGSAKQYVERKESLHA